MSNINIDEFLKEIRPYIISDLQNKKVNEYKKLYREMNNHEPSKEHINSFITMMIASEDIPKEADDIITELKNEILGNLKKSKLLDGFIFGSIIYQCIYVIIDVLYSYKMIPAEFFSGLLKNPITMIDAVIISIYLLFIHINQVKND